MSIPTKYARSTEAREAGWVSRRHQNPNSRDINVNKFEADKKAIRVSAELRASELDKKRSPRERLQILDERLGEGQGAKRERARLAKLISKGHEEKK